MLAPVRTVPPAEDPVGMDEIKRQIVVDHPDDDLRLEFLLQAATDHFDGWTGVLGRALVTQTWRQDFSGFGCLRLPLWPVQSVAEVSYFSAANAKETLDASVYELRADALGSYVDLMPGLSWPSVYGRADAVSVTYVAGQRATEIPKSIKNAIIAFVKMNYDPMTPADREAWQNFIDVSTAPFRRVGI